MDTIMSEAEPMPSSTSLYQPKSQPNISKFVEQVEKGKFIQLYKDPIGPEAGIAYCGIPSKWLDEIGKLTGEKYSYGHLFKFAPGAKMVIPILAKDPCLLVCLRGKVAIHLEYLGESGDGSQSVDLERDETIKTVPGASGIPIIISNKNMQNHGDEPETLLAWLDVVKPRGTYTAYSCFQREYAVFLRDVGWTLKEVAQEIGGRCSPANVLRWHRYSHINARIRHSLEEMIKKVEFESSPLP